MSQKEMFELSFQRPANYFHLSNQEQWDIDKSLGILDWEGEGLTTEELNRFIAHYK